MKLILVVKGTYVGLALKGIRSTLVEDYTASAVALDMGILCRTPIKGLSVGLSLLNNGTEMKFIDEGDALPQKVVVGAGYEMSPMKSVALKVGSDYIKERDEDGAVNVGLEVGLLDKVMVRTGYYTDSDLGSVTMGIGIRLGWVQLDYGYGMMDELNSLHKASLTFRWDTEKEKIAKKKSSKDEIANKKAPLNKKVIRKK